MNTPSAPPATKKFAWLATLKKDGVLLQKLNGTTEAATAAEALKLAAADLSTAIQPGDWKIEIAP